MVGVFSHTTAITIYVMETLFVLSIYFYISVRYRAGNVRITQHRGELS